MICFRKNTETQKFEQVTREELTLSIPGEWVIWTYDEANVRQLYRIRTNESEMELVGLQIDV